MFIGDFEKSVPWSESGVKGCRRFLDRVWKLQDIVVDGDSYSEKMEIPINRTIKKVTEDYENLKFNTAIAALMSLLNEFNDVGKVNKAELKTYLLLLNPVAPHITEEMWREMGFEGMLNQSSWPKWDEDKISYEEVEIAIQVNGKVRGKVVISVDDTKNEVKEKVMNNETVSKFIEGKTIIKEIYVPGRIYNIVVK